MMDHSIPLMNGMLSSESPSPSQRHAPPPSHNDLGVLQTIDLQLILNSLLHDGILTLSEQQVVLQESSKEKRCQVLMQTVCCKGWIAMESFFKTMAIQHQLLFRGSSATQNGGTICGNNGTNCSGSVGMVTGSQSNHQDQPPYYPTSSSFSSLDTPTPNPIHPPPPTPNNPSEHSPIHRLAYPISSGLYASPTAASGGGSFQEEISKAIEEKFGRVSSGNNHNCEMVFRLPPASNEQQLELQPESETDVTDGMVKVEQKTYLLTSIPESMAAGNGLGNEYPNKSPKISNRNLDMSSSCPNRNAGSSMVAQLLALSHNPNKSPNYINAASDAIDPAAGTGPSAGLGNMGLHPGLAGGGVNEEHDSWEFHEITLTKMPPYGFGIAVSGGRDNPHFANGDASIAVSDVLKAGPAEGRLNVNDRIITVNGINLENVDYLYAVGVLKDSPATVNLVVKRRAIIPIPPTPSSLRYGPTSYAVTIGKPPATSKRKDDFNGLVFGCILYVKEITSRSLTDVQGIQIGDTVLRIGNAPVDHMTFNEIKKVLDKRPKDRVPMVFQRSRGSRPTLVPNGFPVVPPPPVPSNPNTPPSNQHRRQSSQNVYTELPTKTDNHVRQKSVDSMEGKLVNAVNRGDRSSHAVRSSSMNLNLNKPEIASPLTLQRSSIPSLMPKTHPDGIIPSSSNRGEGGFPITSPYLHVHTANKQDSSAAHDAVSLSSDWRFPDPRYVSFRKDGSVGLRLTGGNDAGIFVAASQLGSPAALAGLVPGDKILKVNDKDMKGITREEAVLFLLNLNDQIEMVVQHRKQEFDYIIANQIGDSFYIRTHFTYDPDNKNDVGFQPGDVFRVLDTLHTGSIGSWFVTKIGTNKVESTRGSIPSASRAEEMARNIQNGTKSGKPYSNTLADRIRRRSRRTKSLTKDQWADEVAFAKVESKFPAYERIVLKMPHFQRPIVFYGPLADIAREKLVQEFPERYAGPQMDKGEEKSGIVRLSDIRQLMAQNKHCVLDVTCQAVDRLNYAQMYPIVIFMKADSKDVIKEIRSTVDLKRKSSKKLILEAQKLEKQSAFLFTGLVPVKNKNNWFRSVCEMIEQQQQTPIWMSEKPPENPLTDDFLFPMASSSLYSCASSGPESDGENLYDTAPVPPIRKQSKDESSECQSSPLINSQSAHAGMNGAAECVYRHTTSNAVCEFKENRPVGGKQYVLPPRTEHDDASNNINIFATLRVPKPVPSASSNLSRRPRPPPITLPPAGQDHFSANGKPTSSVSLADLPSISNGTPSTSGTYEDPKTYDPYRFTRSTTHTYVSTTLEKNHRHPHHHSLKPPPEIHSVHHPNSSPSNISSRQPSISSGDYSNAASLYSARHPSIKEEQAPPLPPKPKYLTNGRLKMAQSGHMDNRQSHGSLSEQSVMHNGSEDINGTYGKLPYRSFAQKCTARPIFLEPNETNGHQKTTGLRPHDTINFPFADDDRGISPSQMNFPPPPDDFLNSPKKLQPPEVLAEVRGFFDQHGGVLSSEETGVSLVIPCGAIAVGTRQEVYFKVCREDNILSTLDKQKGERLLSPCVLCGPSGVTFLKPLELKLPHSAEDRTVNGAFNIKSPMSAASRPNGILVERDQLNHSTKLSPKLPGQSGSVSVYVDRF